MWTLAVAQRSRRNHQRQTCRLDQWIALRGMRRPYPGSKRLDVVVALSPIGPGCPTLPQEPVFPSLRRRSGPFYWHMVGVAGASPRLLTTPRCGRAHCSLCNFLQRDGAAPRRSDSTTMAMGRNDSAPGDRHIREGDIIVTAVASHYAIGCLKADGKTQQSLGAQPTRVDALRLACTLAAGTHRVFLYGRPGKNDYFIVDCADV
jgi:hypothetical protein